MPRVATPILNDAAIAARPQDLLGCMPRVDNAPALSHELAHWAGQCRAVMAQYDAGMDCDYRYQFVAQVIRTTPVVYVTGVVTSTEVNPLTIVAMHQHVGLVTIKRRASGTPRAIDPRLGRPS